MVCCECWRWFFESSPIDEPIKLINIKREKRKCILLSNEVAHCLGWWKPKKGILNREKMVFNLIYNLKDYTHIGIVLERNDGPRCFGNYFQIQV